MIQIDVRSNIKQVRAELLQIAGKIEDKATARALNRALDAAATEANRSVRKVYNVKAREVARSMKKRRAYEKQKYALAVLRFSGRRLNLYEFDARQTKAGVSVRVKVGGPRKVLRGTFIATNGAEGRFANNFTGIWRRVGRERYPIKNIKSVSIPQMIRNKAVIDALRKVAKEVFTKTFRQQVKLLGQLGA